jgi:hypothetical protein
MTNSLKNPPGNADNAPNVNVPAPRHESVPDFIAPTDAGKGLRPEDRGIPNALVVQSTSHCLDKDSDRYVANAKPSDIVIWPSPDPVHDGAQGIPIIPVIVVDTFIESAENGLGFLARHLELPADTMRQIDQVNGRSRLTLTRPCGTFLRANKELYALYQGMPLSVWHWSTRFAALREMTTLASLHPHPSGGTCPLYSRRYLMRTVARKNSLGRWWGIRYDDLGFVTKPEYDIAREFYALVERGAHRVDLSGFDAA